jgi:hypothetical protein
MLRPDAGRKAESSACLQVERRAYVRLACDLSASLRESGSLQDVGWPGRVRNISQGGVGLLLTHRFRPGTNLDIELRDGSGRLLRTVRARVKHASARLVEGNYCWRLGCEFDQPLTEDELRELQST